MMAFNFEAHFCAPYFRSIRDGFESIALAHVCDCICECVKIICLTYTPMIAVVIASVRVLEISLIEWILERTEFDINVVWQWPQRNWTANDWDLVEMPAPTLMDCVWESNATVCWYGMCELCQTLPYSPYDVNIVNIEIWYCCECSSLTLTRLSLI